jgi:hypothetical protein
MSLDVSLTEMQPVAVFENNITHNLTEMAKEGGFYKHLWRPEALGYTHAFQLIEPLESALERLLEEPDRFKKFNPKNGWGDYEGLVRFVEAYLNACKEHPMAKVEVSR